MQTPPLDPPVSDTAPSAGVFTSYDEQHLVTYLRLLGADAEGADWREVPRSSSISIRRASPIKRAGPGTLTWRDPVG